MVSELAEAPIVSLPIFFYICCQPNPNFFGAGSLYFLGPRYSNEVHFFLTIFDRGQGLMYSFYSGPVVFVNWIRASLRGPGLHIFREFIFIFLRKHAC